MVVMMRSNPILYITSSLEFVCVAMTDASYQCMHARSSHTTLDNHSEVAIDCNASVTPLHKIILMSGVYDSLCSISAYSYM